ncbi:Lrp/AsnC family transcriptional regulator [Microbacterium halotolerans]|uniref:Lrp/AsnC family transcriptional regulator n=1 Tax=Microbacterium halotolerans TaxID=246613 RepID=UPI000E6ABA4D|nr:Lrp/AsnC family transcriptional regulator [Microbacterium halotolerans]
MSNSSRNDSRLAGRNAALDEISYQILDSLRTNGRISIAALAEQVGISRSSAYTRVENLMQTGVITGFSAQIDASRAGLSVCALVFVTVLPQSWASFRDRITELPDIEYCAITTGEHDAMLLVRATDVGGIHTLTTAVIATLPEVRTIVSVVVLDEVVRRPYVLPTDLPEREGASQLGMTRWTPAAEGRASMRSEGG